MPLVPHQQLLAVLAGKEEMVALVVVAVVLMDPVVKREVLVVLVVLAVMVHGVALGKLVLLGFPIKYI